MSFEVFFKILESILEIILVIVWNNNIFVIYGELDILGCYK